MSKNTEKFCRIMFQNIFVYRRSVKGYYYYYYYYYN
jgi:hypothetical protein